MDRMNEEAVPKGLRTKQAMEFTKLYKRMSLIEELLQKKAMENMAEGQRLGQMLNEMKQRRKMLLKLPFTMKHELPGQEEKGLLGGGEGEGGGMMG